MHSKLFKSLLLTAAVVLSTGAQAKQASHTSEVHFSYDGATGPSHWYSLKPEWKTCKNGLTLKPVKAGELHQSPVDFRSAKAVDPKFTLHYDQDIRFKMANNGHSIIFNVLDKDKAYIDINKKRFNLKQFHFHYLSEHTLKGKHTPMEVHFVNIADDGSIAVLGVFIDEVNGQGNPMLEKAFSQTIPPKGYANKPALTLNPSKILPGGKVYSYSGSLTTPPCTEGVIWNVYVKHIGLSKEKVKAFKSEYDHNYRPVTGTY